ncbi:hypothetical protein LTSESEN_1934 [Salmonella enterica subsp. enterica serovar Senftenberg str. A4-543]|uniref:Uncharacterized protein n=1 Tax=Salmonella enterica subsp. enterica serovar Senftenberg str. A4-543 TaxID=913082 RepID=G5QYL1_SALSE|nr:hypothetical protein LTSESEN_1934 [Salmonella enterica subsp. enterica serovar Senftenberg str. A4-543]
MRSRAINAKARQKKAAVMTCRQAIVVLWVAVMTYRCWSVCPHRFG